MADNLMKIKEIALGISIMILTIFVSFYGINTLFPKPEYNNFCQLGLSPKIPLERDFCPSVCIPMYQISRDSCVYTECGSGCGPDNITTFKTLEECNTELYNLSCYERYDEAVKERSRKIFFIALPLGVLIITAGAFLFGLEAVGAGLMGGGIGTLIYGSGAYWPYTENWVRFFLSLVGLILLIFFAYYFNKRNFKKNK